VAEGGQAAEVVKASEEKRPVRKRAATRKEKAPEKAMEADQTADAAAAGDGREIIAEAPAEEPAAVSGATPAEAVAQDAQGKPELLTTPELKTPPEELEKKEAPKETKKNEKKKGKRPIKGVELLEEEGGLEEELPTGRPEEPVSSQALEEKKEEAVSVMEVYTQTDLYGTGRVPAGKRFKKKRDRKGIQQLQPVRKKRLRIGDTITVANLAREMGLKVSEVIRTLMNLGVMASQTSTSRRRTQYWWQASSASRWKRPRTRSTRPSSPNPSMPRSLWRADLLW
jgi:translation initiation factor IF-2